MPCERHHEDELMDRASSGDDAAFGALAAARQDELCRFCLAHGLSGADATDTVQETFLRAYRARRSWRAGGSARAWLAGIAMNVIRESRRKRHPVSDALDPQVLTEALDGDANDEGADPESIAHLAAALAALPPRQREAIACRYLRAMSIRDTAGAMGCAEGTVKATVFAALENLRMTMGQQGQT